MLGFTQDYGWHVKESVWIDVTRDRDKWRALVCAVTNFLS